MKFDLNVKYKKQEFLRMISVIFLIQCEDDLESLNLMLNQNIDYVELICIDNSSSEILKNFKKNQIKVLNYNSKSKLFSSMNELIKNTNREYIYFTTSGLNLDKNELENVEILLRRNKPDCLVFSNLNGSNNSNDFQIIENNKTDFIFEFSISYEDTIVSKQFLLNNNILFENDFESFFYKIKLHCERGMILNNPTDTIKKDDFDEIKYKVNNLCGFISQLDFIMENLYENNKKQFLEQLFNNLIRDYELIMNYSPNINNKYSFTLLKNKFIKQIKCLFDKFYFDFKIHKNIENLTSSHFNFYNEFLVNKNKYRLTVIIPVYNAKKYLKKTLNSIINQSLDFNTIEVIMVDDSSTDRSPSIIKKYSDSYDNIKGIFLEKNSGYAGKPRNVGLTHVSSNYVAFLDADDIYYPKACERLYYSIISNECDIVIGKYSADNINKNVDTFNDNGITYFRNLKEYDYLKFKSIENNPHILTSSNIWNKIFKMSIINKNEIKFPEGVPAEDTGFLFHYLVNARNIIFINELITHYHNLRTKRRDKSVTHIRNKLNLEGRLEVYDWMYDLSLKTNIKKDFVNNLLVPRINYWFSQLIETKLDEYEIKNLFKTYSNLFVECLNADTSISNKYIPILESINNKKFNEINKEIDLLKSK